MEEGEPSVRRRQREQERVMMTMMVRGRARAAFVVVVVVVAPELLPPASSEDKGVSLDRRDPRRAVEEGELRYVFFSFSLCV